MSKKSLWIIAGVAVAVSVVITLKNQGVSYGNFWPLFTSGPSDSASPTPKSTSKPRASATPGSAAAATYSSLVTEYEGRRIQFDKNCQAIPGTVSFKSGTKVMFDNRSGDARTIKIGGTSYTFPGYGYRLIVLTSPTLPSTLNLSCGSAVNVGQILLQASILQ